MSFLKRSNGLWLGSAVLPELTDENARDVVRTKGMGGRDDYYGIGRGEGSLFNRDFHQAFLPKGGGSHLVRAFANTLLYKTYSEYFNDSGHPRQGKTYDNYVLLKDVNVLMKDKDIPLGEAIQYALLDADIHISCTCDSWRYHGFLYKAMTKEYLYGLPRWGGVPAARRSPKVTNPGLFYASCKHCEQVMRQMLEDGDVIAEMFGVYYKRLPEQAPDEISSVTPDGEVEVISAEGEGGVIGVDSGMNEVEEVKPAVPVVQEMPEVWDEDEMERKKIRKYQKQEIHDERKSNVGLMYRRKIMNYNKPKVLSNIVIYTLPKVFAFFQCSIDIILITFNVNRLYVRK